MSKYTSITMLSLIRRSVFQAILFAFLVGIFLCFGYGFVQYYKQQRQQVQQLAELLATSASTVDGASLVAQQVEVLLDKDPIISSIAFYSSESPIVALDKRAGEQQNRDWYNALFADSISFNRAVTSRYVNIDNNYHAYNESPLSTTQAANNPLIDTDQPSASLGAEDVLIGYINITLDIKKLRLSWLSQYALILLSILVAAIIGLLFILRRLRRASEDVSELSKVCQMVANRPDIDQLPAIQQQLNLKELKDIRLALLSLFNHAKTLQQKLDSLAHFEQQLHNKDLSLNIQRDNFQSMITHELKTSLNAISGGLQLLEGQYATAEQKDTLAMISKGSQHLENTIEQIIQLNKIAKGQMSITVGDFNPLQLLSDVFAEFEAAAKQKGLELSSRIYHIDYQLKGDAGKIRQIVEALIENAIKFTESGQIIVESQLSHLNNSIRWEIKVSDTGIGIDKRYYEDIFVPFFQVDPSSSRDYEGVGIGLPVLKQIVQLLGASIELTSELGVGSQFTVTLPLQYAYQTSPTHSKKALAELNIIYYYQDEWGLLVEQLQGFGATVSSCQHELLVLQKINSSKVDMLMIAQDVLPQKAIQLAQSIRSQESRYRVLIIYWYPEHQPYFLENHEYSLKAAGVDFCYSANQEKKALYNLLKANLYHNHSV